MSEKTLGFFSKVENWHFERKWFHFLLAFLTLIAFGTLSVNLGSKNILLIFTNFLNFVLFWGLIVTGIDEKRYGDRLKRLFAVFFMSVGDFVLELVQFILSSASMPIKIDLYSTLVLIVYIVMGVFGWHVAKRIVEQLEEKDFSNSEEF